MNDLNTELVNTYYHSILSQSLNDICVDWFEKYGNKITDLNESEMRLLDFLICGKVGDILLQNGYPISILMVPEKS